VASPPTVIDPAAWLLLCGASGTTTPGTPLPTYLVPSVAVAGGGIAATSVVVAGGFIDPARTVITRT
jgi:hypothetical protein